MRRAFSYFLIFVLFISASFIVLAVVLPLPQSKPYSLIVLDRNGEFLHAFLAPDGIWRFKTSPAEIPSRLKEILLHKEDRFFYYHPGINPIAVVRAVFQNLARGKKVSGASTITMQVARMLESRDRTYLNKCIEMFHAVQLEMRYSKDQILEMYLSMVPLGGNIEGLQSAAYLYYQTPLERLNLAELVDLILLPNDPNGLRPDKNSEKLYLERKRVALEWLSEGFLTKQDSIVLWQTPASVNRSQLPRFAHHFVLRVKELYPGENMVVSSLDLKTQTVVEKILARHVRTWAAHNVFNGAAVVIDNATHGITAYVGSEDFDDSAHNGQVDAVQALRSPGSTLKPFLYALGIDNGTLTSKTRLLDVPYDADGYSAENYDGTYAGWVYADDALRHSLNAPMVRLLEGVGAKTFTDHLIASGFKSLAQQKEKLGLSIILGGCGVTLEELTSAYGAFAHAGMFVRPSYTKGDSGNSSKVFSEAAAFIVTDILSKYDQSESALSFSSIASLPEVAYKTGTSYGRRDAWCIGYSSEFTVGVWLGNADNTGAPDLVSTKATVPLFADIFDAISAHSSKIILPMPSDVAERKVCAHSGKLPSSFCTSLTTDLYSRSQTLQSYCDVDKEFYVSLDGKVHYCTSCLGSHPYKLKVFEDFPPEYVNFLNSTGHPYTPLPPHNPSCERVFAGKGPRIISPTKDMTYLLVSKKQTIALYASSGVNVKVHHWYVDNKFIARRKQNEKIFFGMGDGQHTITCVDDKGRSSSINIKVRHL